MTDSHLPRALSRERNSEKSIHVCGDCPFLHFMEKRVKTKEKLRLVPGTKRGVLDISEE